MGVRISPGVLRIEESKVMTLGDIRNNMKVLFDYQNYSPEFHGGFPFTPAKTYIMYEVNEAQCRVYDPETMKVSKWYSSEYFISIERDAYRYSL
jgi:hypothetical protein